MKTEGLNDNKMRHSLDVQHVLCPGQLHEIHNLEKLLEMKVLLRGNYVNHLV